MGARSGPEACRAARGDAEHRSLESRASRRLAAPQVAAAPGRPVTPISSPLTDVVPNFGVGSASKPELAVSNGRRGFERKNGSAIGHPGDARTHAVRGLEFRHGRLAD